LLRSFDVANQLTDLNVLFSGADAGAVIYPTQVSSVTFCTGDTRYLLPNELANFTVAYRVNRTMEVTTPTTDLRISNDATTAPGFMADFLTARATDPTTRLAQMTGGGHQQKLPLKGLVKRHWQY
jgi:hypothetical protein